MYKTARPRKSELLLAVNGGIWYGKPHLVFKSGSWFCGIVDKNGMNMFHSVSILGAFNGLINYMADKND